VILTAIPLEARAILAHLVDVAIVRGEKGTLYQCGRFPCATGDWFVAVAVTSAGNQGAGSIIQGALHDFREIDLALFVGVAGSLKEDVGIGSVVASSQVYNIHSGKAGTSHLARPRVVTPAFSLVQVANHVALEQEWCLRIRPPRGMTLPAPALPPIAYVAPIASCEQVVVSKKSPAYKTIRKHFNDAHAVEMEGYGALYAASHFEQVPGIVIRGISDLLEDKDGAADQERQPVAAAHAAAFAFEFLSIITLLDGSGTSPLSGAEHRTSASIPNIETAASASNDRATVALVLDGEPSSFDEPRLDSIVSSIRESAGDPTIKLVRVERGSTRLVLEVSQPAARRLTDRAVLSRIEAEQNVVVRAAGPAAALEAATDLEEKFKLASAELLHWSRKLPGGEWLDRPELTTLLGRLAKDEPTATVLLGLPGSGKSALLSALCEKLSEGTGSVPDRSLRAAVLAIKADLLPPDIDSDSALQRYLGLPVDPAYAVEQLARWKRVVLIIDQLDALAYHVDLSTGRLNVLLNLIRRLSGTANVYIVVSCRTFEFEHDARLRSIDAESINLELPAWHAVSSILQSKGIEADAWPMDARELLRSPQALRIFLELLETERDRGEVFSTYRAMLDRLWRDRVLLGARGSHRAALATDLATTMATEEALWLAEARFEDRAEDLSGLEAASIIVRSSKGAAIGFSHQTVFEHALARAFARTPGGLSRYVLERQASLFVRPKLWLALGYLRDVESKAYEHELVAIWSTPHLRSHLRHLLIESLGQQTEPSDTEELLLAPVIRDRLSPFRAAALRAIAGSPGWFRRLKAAIADLMREAEPSPSVLAPLRAAWRFAGADVTELIRTHWFRDPTKDPLTWLILEECPRWDASVLEMATTVLRRSEIDSFRVNHVASTIGVEQPSEALALVRAALDRDLDKVEAAPREPAPPFPETGSTSEQVAWSLQYDARRAYERLFENRSDYYDLPELARTAPIEFVDQLWPWYLRIFYATAGEPLSSGNGYRADRLSALEFEHDGDEDRTRVRDSSPLVASLHAGIEALAMHSSDTFLRWAGENSGIDLLSVQRLIASGFLADIDRYATEATDFLLSDPRRLMLGDFRDRFSTTKALISALVPRLPKDKVLRLETAASSFESLPRSEPDSPPKDRRSRQKAIRRDRLRLLRAFPREALSEKTRQRIPEEERALANPPDTDFRMSGVGWIGSPMSAQAMAKAKDGDILKILNEIDDATEWDHPEDWMRGGSIQLSREFAEFARLAPERAARIIRRLSPGRQERPAAYAIEAIARGATEGAPDAKVVNTDEKQSKLVLELIRELDSKGFGKWEYREAIGHAVARLTGRDTEVPDDILALLERWLSEPVPYQEEEEGEAKTASTVPDRKDEKANDRDRSLLWGYGHIGVLPHGNYPILEALARALLSRRPMAISRWLAILNAHLPRPEDPAVWRAALQFLRYLANGDRVEASTFLGRLFDTYPDLLESLEATMLIAQVQWWVDDARLRSWLDRLAASERPLSRQAYGELVGLVAILRPDTAWFATARAIASPGPKGGGDPARAGLAYAAANLWGTPEYRHHATELLVLLMPEADVATSKAILDLFRVNDQLQPDGPTVHLLENLAKHPDIIRLGGGAFLVERLQTLLPHEAGLVGRLGLEIADLWKASLGDLRTAFAADAPQLVDIALTLHRLGGDARENGMTLFEMLLDAEAYGARDTLEQIDNKLRPRAATGPHPRLRRSRRRRRQSA
jgi:nucleoside phosphorylase